MKKSKLKISIFSKFLIIFSVLLFSSETNAKSANSHLDDLDVVQNSLILCSRTLTDLLSTLMEQTTAEVSSTTTTTHTRPPILPTRPHILPTRFTRPNFLPTRFTRPHFLPTRFTRPHFLPTRFTRPHFLPTRFTRPPTTTTVAPRNDWGEKVEDSLSKIDDIVSNFEDNLEDVTNANKLVNETEVLQALVKEGEDDDSIVKQSNYAALITHATNTQKNVDDKETDVADEYDKYDKQRKVTISLSTLGAAIVISLIIVMLVIYIKKRGKKDNSSDTSSESGDPNDTPEVSTDLYMSSQERFGIPRVKSSYVKDGQPSVHASTSRDSSSSSSKMDSEKVDKTRY